MRVWPDFQDSLYRFRLQHRYDHRFLFILLDVTGFLFKALLFLAFTWGLWYSAKTVLQIDDRVAAAFSQPVAVVASEAPPQQPQVGTAESQKPAQHIDTLALHRNDIPDDSDSQLQKALSPPSATPIAEPAVASALSISALPQAAIGAANRPDHNASNETTSEAGTVDEVVVIPAAALPRSNANVVVLEDDWMLAQDGSKYTIQIGSTPNLLFLRRFGLLLPGDQQRAVYHYKNTPDGSPEYGLAWGVYDTVPQAQQVLTLLDEESKRFSPWIRRVRGIQKQMDAR